MSDNLIDATRDLFAAISDNARTWLRYWSDITLHPKIFATRFYFSAKSCLTFFVINNAIGFFVFLLILCSFWSIFFTRAFRVHWHGSDVASAVFILAAPYFFAVLSSILIVITGLIAFSIFHATHAKGTLLGHISRALVCTNLEWITAIFFAVVFLANDELHGGWQVSWLILTSICIIAIRLYYAFLQTTLMSSYHYNVGFSPFVAFVTTVGSIATGVLYAFIYFVFLAIAIGIFD
jgi:hypothetical protein